MNEIRTLVRGAYDIQKLRIQTGNRIVGNFKAKLGQLPGEAEETLDERSRDLLAVIRAGNKLVTEGAITELESARAKRNEAKVAEAITSLLQLQYRQLHEAGAARKRTFPGNPVISDYTEFCLIRQYVDLADQEAEHFSSMARVLKDYPIVTEFLDGVKGCGPAMAGVILSEIDITKARYASSLWKLAGLDVAQDGKGRSRRREHLVEREYTTSDGEQATRSGITFNPFLKTKLYVLATCFIKVADSPYRKVYDDYKHRLENHPEHQSKTKGHRHAMAMRYMVKRFLADLYRVWRPLEGLPVEPEYHEGKLGHKHAA